MSVIMHAGLDNMYRGMPVVSHCEEILSKQHLQVGMCRKIKVWTLQIQWEFKFEQIFLFKNLHGSKGSKVKHQPLAKSRSETFLLWRHCQQSLITLKVPVTYNCITHAAAFTKEWLHAVNGEFADPRLSEFQFLLSISCYKGSNIVTTAWQDHLLSHYHRLSSMLGMTITRNQLSYHYL